MPSTARTRFDEQRTDIDQLWAIHEEVAGVGVGRKHGVDVLNRSVFVFITACWESFVEDVCLEGFDYLLDHAATMDVFPARVRTLASRDLRNDNDERRIWELAGEGWRQVLRQHRDAAKERWISSLNTPKTAQVTSLFDEMLGLANLSDAWTWQHMNAQQAADKLDQYIVIRGNIAHRTQHDDTVYKNWGTDYLRHVERLVEKSDDCVRGHIRNLVGSAPW